MATLTKQQTEFIRQGILQGGISQPELAEDLLDHICTAVETAMASGESFEKAYEQAMSCFGKNELKQVEVKTEALLAGETIYYPTIKQSLGLMVLYFILIFFIGFIINAIKRALMVGDPQYFTPAYFDQYTLLFQCIQVCGALILVILFGRVELRVRSFTKVDIAPVHAFPLSVIPILLGILFVWSIWMEVMYSFIRIPDALQAAITQRITHYPPLTVLLFIGILWPLLSEILFRGIILKGMLRKYSPLTAIVCSSILFAVSLLNPYNVVPFFLIGLFCGWLYYRTQSILPSLLFIVISQLAQIFFILWIQPQGYRQLMIWRNLINNDVLYYSLGVVSFLFTLLLVWLLNKKFNRHLPLSQLSME